MAYCRFANTLEALRECAAEIDLIDELSPGEATSRIKLIKLCARIADENSVD